MAYVPLNRILTDQYTSGGEYYVASSGEPYAGFYHEYYTGEAFSGNNPSFSYKQRLVRNRADVDIESNQDYIVSLDVSANFPKVASTTYRTVPSYFPQPTQEDYTIGTITRYFAKETNTLRFTEVSSNTYNELRNGSSKYLWTYYTTFNLPWTISGEELQAAQTNKKNVQVVEKLYSVQGLGLFLQENYTKFYKK